MIEVFLLGVLFGIGIAIGRLSRFNTIIGMATLKDLTVAKALLTAIGLGTILLSFEVSTGFASFHLKPLMLGGVVLGAIIFGIGMAILGYCPGTLVVAAGEGALDAIIGVVGGLLGGLTFTLLYPIIKGALGPNLGKISIYSIIDGSKPVNLFTAVILGSLMIYVAILLHRREGATNKGWLLTGIWLGLLNPIVFLLQNRPIGASTAYPYVIAKLLGLSGSDYFLKIQKPGYWEVIFLLGALVGSLLISLTKREFALKLVHERWSEYQGTSKLKRSLYAFLGGFILIFGARMAGGCTSGHVLSGGMQLAVSSIIFTLLAFTSFMVTGKLFYNVKLFYRG